KLRAGGLCPEARACFGHFKVPSGAPSSIRKICGRTAIMAQTVGDFLVERLHAWGVRTIFGYPGDGINGVFGALNRADGKIRFIQARHEEMAAFMASAHAKFTGELGVCIATSGPGAAHLVTGLYDARLD